MRPTLRIDALALFVSLSAIVIGCGGSVVKNDPAPNPQQNVDAGQNPPSSKPDPGPPPRVPSDHRASPSACSTVRGPGTTEPDSHFKGDCKTDADCTSGDNGRCLVDISDVSIACSYDECTTDAQCGSGVCNCRADSRSANRCFNGSCATDADCGSSYCSPSGTKIQSNCLHGPDGDVPASSFGYFCHTRDDECVDDKDCGAPYEQACLFNTTAKKWTCRKLWCTG